MVLMYRVLSRYERCIQMLRVSVCSLCKKLLHGGPMTRVSHATGSGPLYAGLEAGGTKCICAVGTGPDDLRACTQFATTTPSETMAHAAAFFEAYRSGLMALGIASFGPLDPRPHSASFGSITSTPKPALTPLVKVSLPPVRHSPAKVMPLAATLTKPSVCVTVP